MSEARKRTDRPAISCEITATSVIAARTRDHVTVDAVHARSLPPGAVTPSLTGENIHDHEAVSEAILDAITSVGGRGKDIVAVVPDSSVRVTLLDFESIPERYDEAQAIVRFRLKKSVPFDIDKAAVSFDSSRGERGIHTVIAVMLRSVLDEYEAVFRAAGSEPGFVIPSTLAALGAIDGARPTMLLKLDPGTTSLAIVDADQLLLFRTLEAGRDGSVLAEQVAEDVYPSLVYFQDTYGVDVERVVIAGAADVADACSVLAQHSDARVEDLMKSPAMPVTGARSDASGAIGALLL